MKPLLLSMLLVTGGVSAAPWAVDLSVTNEGCQFDVVVNGIALASGDTSQVFNVPLNTWLAGKDNRVEVSAKPAGDACALEFKVTLMDRANWRTTELARGKLDKDKPKVSATFVAPVDVLGPWKKVAPFSDQKALKAYAVRLVELARAGDWAAWEKEAAPKFDQVAVAFGVPRQALVDSAQAGLGAFGSTLRPLGLSEVVAEPLLDGRLWRLRARKHPRALMVVAQPDGELAQEVVVGVVDGQLRVVR